MHRRRDRKTVCFVREVVMGDVALVLRHATTGSGDPARALAAARNVCHVLFNDRHTPDPTIPSSFWDTPLGRAVTRCCDDTPATPPARHPLRLPAAMQAEVRAEIEALNRTLAAQVSIRLRRQRAPVLHDERRRAA